VFALPAEGSQYSGGEQLNKFMFQSLHLHQYETITHISNFDSSQTVGIETESSIDFCSDPPSLNEDTGETFRNIVCCLH
jgi:hypothetical protein